jgi:spermidine/putrescine transport system substrate-binding protein
MVPADTPNSPARRVRFLCWDDYVDPACLAEFTAETGVGVETVVMKNDDDCIHRVTSGEPFDAVLGTDYAAQVLIGRGLVRPLSLDHLPNWSLVTDARFREPVFDPGTGGVKYTSVNYWGTEGFAVRIDKVPHVVNSWKMLFDETYAGQIAMLGGAREVFAPALYLLGSDCNCTDRALVAEATEMLIAQHPLVVSYDSSDVRSHLLDGTAVVHCWNGDAASALSHGVFQIAYLLPDEGFSAWMDAPFIPARASDPEAAHQLLDFLLRPEVAARNADFSGYMPVLPAADALVKSAVQRSLQPLESQAARGVFQRDLGAFNGVYEEAFLRVLAL